MTPICLRKLRSACGLSALALSIAGTIPGRAELPPPYTVWEDFGAIARQAAIPDVLGVVDRIERGDGGKYIVRAGPCFVEAAVKREGAQNPDGRPLVGPSHVAEVTVGERRCN